MQFILFFAPRRHLCSIFLVTGCAKEIRKISISSLESLLEEQSLSTRDVGRFIGLLLETVRNRYSFQPLRLILYIYIYMSISRKPSHRIKENILFIAAPRLVLNGKQETLKSEVEIWDPLFFLSFLPSRNKNRRQFARNRQIKQITLKENKGEEEAVSFTAGRNAFRFLDFSRECFIAFYRTCVFRGVLIGGYLNELIGNGL